MTLVVQKYGGTSVGTLERIKAVAAHIRDSRQRFKNVVVVVSAMGDRTDELLALAHEISQDPPTREVDMLLTAGERISMALLAIALHEVGVPSQSLTGSQSGILTDETHGNARIIRITGERIREGISTGRVLIVAGFQGVSPLSKEITTLGRGGSDLTAIGLAQALGAQACEIYKDVDGVFTADPRLVPDAQLLSEISWDTMRELAWAGASVLHSRGAHVAAKFSIPLTIRSSFHPDRPGTVVKGKNNMETPKIQALAHKKNIASLTVSLTGNSAAKTLSEASTWLWTKGEAPLVTQASVIDGTLVASIVLKDDLVDGYLLSLKQTAKHSQTNVGATNLTSGLASITVIGEGFSQAPELVTKAISALRKSPVVMEVRNSAVVFCVGASDLEEDLKSLHNKLIKNL